MGVDKHLNAKSMGEPLCPEDKAFNRSTDTQRQIRLIISRAAVAYLLFFLVFGLVMSTLRVDPLARNWLMPKALLVFVGLSTLIALVNTMLDYSRETGLSWYGLVQYWFRFTFKSKK